MKTVLIWLKSNHEILKAAVPVEGTAAFFCSTQSDRKTNKTTIFLHFGETTLYSSAKKARLYVDGTMPVIAKNVVN